MNLDNETIDWILKVKRDVPVFLNRLKGQEKKGFFHYSLSGDLFPERENWGLGNTVFAAKAYYTIDALKSLAKDELQDISSFIKKQKAGFSEANVILNYT